jgi:hypothetical protein
MKWTPDVIAAEIDKTRLAIKVALHAGDMKFAQLLVSKTVGLRICGGEIAVKLRAVPAQWAK